jgi:DNA repair protein SbcC/Rad50
MQLRRVTVRNIRSHAHSDLLLGPGITLLWGDVGSGKSSLLYAVEMALFGFAEFDPAFLVRHQALHAEVALTLEDPGGRYELRRRFRRQTRRGHQSFAAEENSFARNGARTTYSATELRQRAIDLLGFPDNPNPRARSDFWRWAVYIPQERMREVLAQDPEERLETVRKALGVEKFRVAAQNVGELGRELHRRADLQDEAAQMLAHHAEELPRLLEERNKAQEAYVSARKAETGLQAALSEAERQTKPLALAVAALAADRRELESAAGRLGDIERAEAEKLRQAELRRTESRQRLTEAKNQEATVSSTVAPSVEDVRQQLSVVRERGEALEGARRDLSALEAIEQRSHADQDRQAGDLERVDAETRQGREELEKRLQSGPRHRPMEATARSLPEIGAAISAAEQADEAVIRLLAEAEHEVADLSSLVAGGVCPRCHQTVKAEDFVQHRTEAERRLETLRGQRLETLGTLERLRLERAARERFEHALLRWESVESERSAAREALARLASERERLLESQQRSILELERTALQRQGLAPRVTELEALRKERQRLEALQTESEQRLAERTSRAEAARRLSEAAELLAEEAKRLDAEAKDLRSERARLEGRMSVLSEQIRNGTQRQEELDELNRRLSALRAEAKSTGELRTRLESDLQRVGRDLERAERGLEEQKARQAEAGRLRRLSSWLLGDFREALLQLERRLLAHAQGEFDRLFARYFATLVEDPALQARCDGAFTPTVEIDGEWTPAEAMSGGERTALALAFRLALGAVVRRLGHLRLDTLILDEPTDGFSPEQVTRMGELLEEIGMPQILLVSHESQLAGIADRVVRVTKKDGLSRLQDAAAPTPLLTETANAPELVEAPVAPARARPRRKRSAVKSTISSL